VGAYAGWAASTRCHHGLPGGGGFQRRQDHPAAGLRLRRLGGRRQLPAFLRQQHPGRTRIRYQYEVPGHGLPAAMSARKYSNRSCRSPQRLTTAAGRQNASSGFVGCAARRRCRPPAAVAVVVAPTISFSGGMAAAAVVARLRHGKPSPVAGQWYVVTVGVGGDGAVRADLDGVNGGDSSFGLDAGATALHQHGGGKKAPAQAPAPPWASAASAAAAKCTRGLPPALDSNGITNFNARSCGAPAASVPWWWRWRAAGAGGGGAPGDARRHCQPPGAAAPGRAQKRRRDSRATGQVVITY